MDLNQLAVFVRVIDSGSFTQAARILKQPKSRVSRKIAALEEELKTALLYRSTRQSSPTEAGWKLYHRCRNQVYELEAATSSLHENDQEVSGVLKLTVPEDIGLALLGPVLVESHVLYPKLKIDLHLSNQVVDLIREGVDLAIRIGDLEDTTLKKRPLGHIQLILVASPAYLNHAPPVKALSDLSKHPSLVFTTGDEDAPWTFRSNHPKVILDLALAGKGIAWLPEHLCIDELKNGSLQQLLKPYSTQKMPLQFVWPAQRELSPKVRSFINLGIERLSTYFS
jgi:DNA-binding transcriptional LysR family regulator